MAIAVPSLAEKSQAEAEGLFGLGPEPSVTPAVTPAYEGTGEGGGFSPSEIREAYKIPQGGGSGQTVAIVDAYDDPHAESDVEEYRKKYKLSKCNKEKACFKKINQKGEEGNYPTDKYPKYETFGGKYIEDWGREISLDLDMVSAVCPECKILLVEANSSAKAELFAAEEEAAKWKEAVTERKATEISNSWDTLEYPSETQQDSRFDVGIPVTAAAGDSGYGVAYPAASPFVISVGGTRLTKKAGSERGWEESVWNGTGSGCSEYERQPAWQSGLICKGASGENHRTDNDVATVASQESPVSLYDSYEYEEEGYSTGKLGWVLDGGTSVATPIVAATEAHASEAVRKEGPEAFYRHSLFDVTEGANGMCGGDQCNGEEGYDAPTGWGTLWSSHGPFESSAGYHAVTASATSIAPTGATLTGYIDPEGPETSYHFEYGPTTSYGKTLPVHSVEPSTAWEAVSEEATGLAKGATYHYRLIASNSKSGTTYGKDHTFTTVSWALQHLPTPNVQSGKLLFGVSCSAATACVAVGRYLSGADTVVPMAEIWNGAEWSLEEPPSPKEAAWSQLIGVSCPTSTACRAVGWYKKSLTGEEPLGFAESWNGETKKWSVQELPLPASARWSELLGISCSSATACMAVGNYETSSSAVIPMAEQWIGEKWVLEEPPSQPGTSESTLKRVSCASASVCNAVGLAVNSAGTTVTLADYWNGAKWTFQESPNPSDTTWAELTGLSCVSTTSCLAVGYYEVSSGEIYTLAESWEGAKWAIHESPNVKGAKLSYLLGVSCSSITQCVAVGGVRDVNGENGTAAMSARWNGKEWSLLGVPEPEEQAGFVYAFASGVSCVGVTCESVGEHTGEYEGEGYDTALPLAEALSLPSAETDATTTPTVNGATLNGTVNPDGYETTYHFEYGETTSYGKSVPVAEESVGSGTSNVKVSQKITGLNRGTTYHVRLVVRDGPNPTYGEDTTFKTPAAEWRQAGAPLSEPLATKWKGTVKVADTASVTVECEDTAEGSAGPGAAGTLTKWTASNCVTKAGPCLSPSMKAAALPWHAELAVVGGVPQDLTAGVSSGFEIVCAGIVKDTCRAALSTAMVNVSAGADATFDGEKLTCTLSGKATGTMEGVQLIEATKGGKLEAVT